MRASRGRISVIRATLPVGPRRVHVVDGCTGTVIVRAGRVCRGNSVNARSSRGQYIWSFRSVSNYGTFRRPNLGMGALRLDPQVRQNWLAIVRNFTITSFFLCLFWFSRFGFVFGFHVRSSRFGFGVTASEVFTFWFC